MPQQNRKGLGGGLDVERKTWRRVECGDNICKIFAWVSPTGIVVKEVADIVDMVFLGFDRLAPPAYRFPDDREGQEKENEFARLLMKTGGKFWKSQKRRREVTLCLELPDDDEMYNRWFGWEKDGGVWVLEADIDDGKPPETARLTLAISMEERCRILENLGARFYKDPMDCEAVRNIEKVGRAPIEKVEKEPVEEAKNEKV